MPPKNRLPEPYVDGNERETGPDEGWLNRRAGGPYWRAIDVAHPVRSLGDIVGRAIIKTLLACRPACFFAWIVGPPMRGAGGERGEADSR